MKIFASRYALRLITILSLSGSISCEKIIDISIPDKERKIVVNGLISPDQPVRINLSRSLSVLEPDSFIFIKGADARLYNGSGLIGKFQEDSPGFYSLPDFKPLAGQAYRLTASYNGLSTVEAIATLPPEVPIISVDTATLTGEWGQQALRLSIKFKDPAKVKNIYGFGVDFTYKEFDYNTMTYTGKKLTNVAYIQGNTDRFLQDEAINYQGKLYLEDLLFDGITKTVEFGVWDYSFYQSDTVWMNVRMEQIDPSYYLYVVSSNAFEKANGNPFAEPVQVYSNVTGGFGIFAGASSAGFPFVLRGMRKFR